MRIGNVKLLDHGRPTRLGHLVVPTMRLAHSVDQPGIASTRPWARRARARACRGPPSCWPGEGWARTRGRRTWARRTRTRRPPHRRPPPVPCFWADSLGRRGNKKGEILRSEESLSDSRAPMQGVFMLKVPLSPCCRSGFGQTDQVEMRAISGNSDTSSATLAPGLDQHPHGPTHGAFLRRAEPLRDRARRTSCSLPRKHSRGVLLSRDPPLAWGK
jgi:hypothetical protein